MKLSIAVKDIRRVSQESESCEIYEGYVKDDMNWRVNAVPQGGYVFGLVFSALQSTQRKTPHPDPIHLTAHFLASLGDGAFQIEVKTIKKGRSFSNVEAKLIQRDKVCVTVHAICGTLLDFPDLSTPVPSSPTGKPAVFSLIDSGLLPPSTLARRVPLCHPLTPPPATRHRPIYRPYKFANDYLSVVDNKFTKRNRDRTNGAGVQESTRTAESANDSPEPYLEVGNGSFEIGEWITLTDPTEVIDESMIPFFADMMTNLPDMIPKEMRAGGYFWYPTVTMSLSFLYRLPWSSLSRSTESGGISKRTIGLYSQARFLSGPSGRHDAYVELWTAPEGCDLDAGSPAIDTSFKGISVEEERRSKWNEKMICLATSHQMALTLPMSVNESKAAKNNTGAKM